MSDENKPMQTVTLRFSREESDGPAVFDSLYIFNPATDGAFYKWRAKMIQAGLNKGYEFKGFVVGSQLRVPLKYSGLLKLAQKVGRAQWGHGKADAIIELILFDPDNPDQQEIWARNNDCAAHVVEYNGVGFEFVRSEERWDGYGIPQDTRRHKPKARISAGPITGSRLVEEPLFDSAAHRVDEQEFQDFKAHKDERGPRGQRGSAVRLPDLSAMPFDSVSVLERGDDGIMRPTEAFYGLNPLDGEVVKRAADEALMARMANMFVTGTSSGVCDGQLLAAVEALVPAGVGVDYKHVANIAVRLCGEFQNATQMEDVITAMCTTLVDCQHEGQDARDLNFNVYNTWPEIHLNGPVSLCGQEGVLFVGRDRYVNVGLPPHCRLCPECDEAHAHITQTESEAVTHKFSDLPEDVQRQAREMYRDLEMEETERTKSQHARIESMALREVFDVTEGRPQPSAWKGHWSESGYLAMLVRFHLRTEFALIGPNPSTAGTLDTIIWLAATRVDADNATGCKAVAQTLEWAARSITTDRQKDFWEKEYPDPSLGLEEWKIELGWTDQYDEPVPLVLAHLADSFATAKDGGPEDNDAVVEALMNTAWYEIDGHIFVPVEETGILQQALITVYSPADYDTNETECTITRIDDVLKRYSRDDGFYHA